MRGSSTSVRAEQARRWAPSDWGHINCPPVRCSALQAIRALRLPGASRQSSLILFGHFYALLARRAGCTGPKRSRASCLPASSWWAAPSAASRTRHRCVCVRQQCVHEDVHVWHIPVNGPVPVLVWGQHSPCLWMLCGGAIEERGLPYHPPLPSATTVRYLSNQHAQHASLAAQRLALP